jgi:hypothetical protein
MKTSARTQPPSKDNAAPTLTKSYKGETRQGWRRRRSPNGPPAASHRTPPGPTTIASTSQQQTSRGKPTNTSEKSRLPQPEPRLQHSSTPSSLPQESQRNHLGLPLVPLADVQLQRRSPQEGIRHNDAAIVRSQGSRVSPGTAPSTRPRAGGSGSRVAMPPTRSTTATAAAIANHGTNRDQATSTTTAAQHACAGADKPNKHHRHATSEQAPSYEVLTSTSPNRRAKPPTTQVLPLHHGPPCRAAPSLPDAVAASSYPRTSAKQPANARNGRGPPGPRRA